MPAVDVDVTLYRDLRPDEIEEWEALARKSQPPGEVRLGSDLRWADLDAETDSLIRLRDDEGVLRACAWVTQKAVRIAGRDTTVAGIRGVVTDPERRRRGYGRQVMEHAQELMRSFAGCEVALLFSSVMAVPFYESLGWQNVGVPVTCDQPAGRIVYTDVLPGTAPVMVLALAAELPVGKIDVQGYPW